MVAETIPSKRRPDTKGDMDIGWNLQNHLMLMAFGGSFSQLGKRRTPAKSWAFC